VSGVNTSLRARGIRGVILDIEGTTTPVGFVYDTLFPFARERMTSYVRDEFTSANVREAASLLAGEWAGETPPRENPAPWANASADAAAGALAAYALELMDVDRKSRGLKLLQGRIWESGYREGALRGEVYPDVPPALARWHAAGVTLAIYSSGSVLAQRLLLGSTASGDLTRMVSHFFDTEVGAKKEPASYARIASAMKCATPELLFISDSVAEVDAAHAAGMQTLLCARDAATARTGSISTFDGIGA
jgi:enolase-phosphatase E1